MQTPHYGHWDEYLGGCRGSQEVEGMTVARYREASTSKRVSGRLSLRAMDNRNAYKQHGNGTSERNNQKLCNLIKDLATHLPCSTGKVECAGQVVFFNFVVAVDGSGWKEVEERQHPYWST